MSGQGVHSPGTHEDIDERMSGVVPSVVDSVPEVDVSVILRRYKCWKANTNSGVE